MPNPETNILSRANNELEQILERIRLNCEVALEIMQGVEMQDLSLESREQLYGRIHTLREIVRTLSSDFEKKLMKATTKFGRGLSSDEVRSLLYGVAEL